MKKIYISLFCILIFFCFFVIININLSCDGDDEFKIISFTSDKINYRTNEQVILKWSYQKENQLVKQQLKFLKFTFTGVEEEIVPLENGLREYKFPFSRSGTIILYCETSDKNEQASITIYLNNEDFIFSMNVTGTDPLYPDLGYPVIITEGGCSLSIERKNNMFLRFTDFFAFYDENNDSVIEDLINILPSNYFRALSYDHRESYNFKMNEGSIFCPKGFFDDIGMYHPSTYSNVVIYGGTIMTDGIQETYKASDAEGVCRKEVTKYNRIFVAFFYRIDSITNGMLHGELIDIQVGNIDQGLILTVNMNNPYILPLDVEYSESTLYAENIGTPDSITYGNMKFAKLGKSIQKINSSNSAEAVYVSLDNIKFKMTFSLDNMIDNFID